MNLFHTILLATLAMGYHASTPVNINLNRTNSTLPNTTTLDTSTEQVNQINIHLNKTYPNYKKQFINIAKSGQISPNRILKSHTEVIKLESFYTPNLVNSYNLPIKTGIYRGHTLKLQEIMPDIASRIHGLNSTFKGPSLPNLLTDRLQMIENIVQKIRLKCAHYIYDHFQPANLPDLDISPYTYLPGIAPTNSYKQNTHVIHFPNALIDTIFSINTTTIMNIKNQANSDSFLNNHLSTELKTITFDSLQRLIYSCKRANIELPLKSPPLIFISHTPDMANAVLSDYMRYSANDRQSNIMDPEACIHSMALYLTDLELKFRMLLNKPIPNNIYSLTVEKFYKDEESKSKQQNKRSIQEARNSTSEISTNPDMSQKQFNNYLQQFFYNESNVKSLVKRNVWMNELAHIFHVATEETELKDRGRINTLTSLYDQIQTSQTDIGTIMSDLRHRDVDTNKHVQAIESQILDFANQTRQQYAGIISNEQYVTNEMQSIEQTVFAIMTLLNIGNQIDVLLQHVEYDHQAVQEILVNEKLPIHLSDFGSSKLISQPNITFTRNQITITIKNSIQQKEYHKIYIHSIPFFSGKHLLRFKFPKTILTDYHREVIDYEAKCNSNLCPNGLRLKKLDSCLSHLLNIHSIHSKKYPDECYNYLQALHPGRPMQDAILLQNGIHLFSTYSDKATEICDLTAHQYNIKPELNVIELGPHCSFSSTEVYIENFITNTRLSPVNNIVEKNLLDDSIRQLMNYNLSVTKIDIASIPLDITKIEENQRSFEIDHLIKKFNSRPSTPFLLQLDDPTSYDTQVTLIIYLILTILITWIIYNRLPASLQQKIIEFICCCICKQILCRRKSKAEKQRALITSMRANLHHTDPYSTTNTSFNSSRYRPTIISNTEDLHNESNKSQSRSCNILNTSMPLALQNYSPMNPLITQNQYHGNIEAIPITYQPPTTVNNEVYPTNKPDNILKNQTNKNSRVVPYNNHFRSSKNFNCSNNSSNDHHYSIPNTKNHPTKDYTNPSQDHPDYQSPIQMIPQPTLSQPLSTSSPKLDSTNREPPRVPLPPPIPKIPPPTSPDSPPAVPNKLRQPTPEELVFKVSFTESDDPEDLQHNN